jgi:hypothetical protein
MFARKTEFCLMACRMQKIREEKDREKEEGGGGERSLFNNP